MEQIIVNLLIIINLINNKMEKNNNSDLDALLFDK